MAKELAKGNDDRTDLNNSASTLKEETTKLDSMLDTARIHFKSKSYKDTILAILQDNPCPLKCQHLIRNVKKANIDSYYLARHEEVKKVIIDAILNEFGDLVKVTAEDRVSYGRLDIKIEFDGRRVVLKDNIKVVGIEIKSGDVVESKHFEQIDRYLFDVNIDLLIRIRVPTEDVVEIQNIYKDVLINDIVRLTNKTRRIMAKEASVVPGKWCKGCEAADCNYADENNFSSNNKGSFIGYEGFKRHVDRVIEKTVAKLRGLIIERNIVHEDDVIHHDIKSSIKDQAEIDNGNGKGKTADTKTAISQLLRANMTGLLIEGRIESIGESQTVNLRTGITAQVAHAIISDETKSIKLILWDNQINSIKEGDNVTIAKGYTKEYLGEINLYVPKDGTLTKHSISE